jgi:hypothetical protein
VGEGEGSSSQKFILFKIPFCINLSLILKLLEPCKHSY